MWYSITLVVGIILIVFAIILLNRSLSFLRNSERTIATVIELERNNAFDGDTYNPIFKFKTSLGKEVIYKHFVSSSPATWYIGETATVVYDPGDPSDAKLLTYFGAFSWTIVLMAIAMPLIVIGGGYFLSQSFLK